MHKHHTGNVLACRQADRQPPQKLQGAAAQQCTRVDCLPLGQGLPTMPRKRTM